MDSYRNLTYKSIMWLKWIALYCPKPPFVLKVDDDIFVNIFSLAVHLQHLQKRKTLKPKTILCLTLSNTVAQRNTKNKWFVTKEEYPNSKYPKYCTGCAYIMTSELVKPMYEMSFKIKV